MTDATTIVRHFVERINAHDVAGMLTLMTADHQFVDAVGASWSGLHIIEQAWSGYFAWMPDYTIAIATLLECDDEVGLFGTASGTYMASGRLRPQNRWQLPAAWKAVVRDGKVAEWHVYCDTKTVYDIMDQNG
jgi:ketosteroid isomerase-like protein